MIFALLILVVMADPSVGAWTLWTPWTRCGVSCDGGLQMRNRSCDNANGANCDGVPQEVRRCSTVECPTAGRWSLWARWSACSTSCGGGVKVRDRKCNNPSPGRNGGKYCVGDGVSIQMCNNRRCQLPTEAGWSPWQPWYGCTVSCDGGVKLRERKCDKPPPGPNIKDCMGSTHESSVCNTHECEAPEVPTDGHWSEWAAWYTCTRSCGGGLELRERKCDNPGPGPKGRNCVGNSHATRACNKQPCVAKESGEWSKWISWSDCTRKCGGGLQLRTRRCKNTPNNCIGVSQEVQECNTQQCAVTTPPPTTKCEGDWKGFWGKCYLFVPCSSKCTSFEAAGKCKDDGGVYAHLATIPSKTHNDFIMANKPDGKYAIGASTLAHGTWLWADVSPVLYSNWLTAPKITSVPRRGNMPPWGRPTDERGSREHDMGRGNGNPLGPGMPWPGGEDSMYGGRPWDRGESHEGGRWGEGESHEGGGYAPRRPPDRHTGFGGSSETGFNRRSVECAMIDNNGKWIFLPCTVRSNDGYVCEQKSAN